MDMRNVNRPRTGGTLEKTYGPASYFPSIERTYGRPIAEWKALIQMRLPGKHMEIVNWLKAEYGMGHGHANALVGYTLNEETAGVMLTSPSQRD
jgi:hypothetical protein